MYQISMRLNRYGAILLAWTWCASLLLPGLREWTASDTLSGLQVFVTLLSAMVIIDKPLARLSFEEVSRELAGISLEEATETFWHEQQQRRRDAERHK